ncbi:nodulin MtN21 /EamA-like transporter family protein [Striga asiatica]|uniref:Nodulin MtN21 /EamA-like transporter family protein n=1 Tax=Striga asiatica TaxID=4170 RepID=A0A5A7R1I4_STRAF|nr:nodulin MtN21 /EamA-like transporter family protein [Striga asiatica]
MGEEAASVQNYRSTLRTRSAAGEDGDGEVAAAPHTSYLKVVRFFNLQMVLWISSRNHPPDPRPPSSRCCGRTSRHTVTTADIWWETAEVGNGSFVVNCRRVYGGGSRVD